MKTQRILFTADWCKPCQELKLWIGDRELPTLTHVDIDSEPQLAKYSGVKAIPTLLVDGTLYTGREEIKPYLETLTN